MSDMWQGPGWWLASDGKWYPADAEPGSSTDAAGSVQTKVEPTTSTIIAAPKVEPDIEPDAEPVVEADGEAEALADPFAELDAEPTAFAEPVVEPFGAGIDEGADTNNVAAMSDTETIGGWQSIVEPTDTSEPVDLSGQWTEPAAPTDAETDGGWSSGYEERQSAPADATPVDEPAPFATPVEPRIEPEITDAVLPDLAPTETIVAKVEAPEVPVAEVPIPDVALPDVPDLHVPNLDVPDLDMAPPAPGVEPIAHTVPDTDIPEVAPPSSIDMNDRIANGEQADEIHRDVAWRKPNGDTETVLRVPAGEGDTPSTAPDVVDLAIPSESPLHPPIESGGGGRSIGLLGAAAVLAVVVGLALLIGWLFTRGDDGELAVNDTPTVTVSSTQPGTTASSAPSTDEPTSSSTTAVTQDEVSVFDLRAGDCIKNEIGQGQVQRLVRVDCAIPHEFEVYREALIDSTITEFDEELISAQAQEVCGNSLADYISPSDTRDLKFKWFQPTADSWSQEDDPDRVITCLLFDESGPLTGRAA